jgi:hypothetical protein
LSCCDFYGTNDDAWKTYKSQTPCNTHAWALSHMKSFSFKYPVRSVWKVPDLPDSLSFSSPIYALVSLSLHRWRFGSMMVSPLGKLSVNSLQPDSLPASWSPDLKILREAGLVTSRRWSSSPFFPFLESHACNMLMNLIFSIKMQKKKAQ